MEGADLVTGREKSSLTVGQVSPSEEETERCGLGRAPLLEAEVGVAGDEGHDEMETGKTFSDNPKLFTCHSGDHFCDEHLYDSFNPVVLPQSYVTI